MVMGWSYLNSDLNIFFCRCNTRRVNGIIHKATTNSNSVELHRMNEKNNLIKNNIGLQGVSYILMPNQQG